MPGMPRASSMPATGAALPPLATASPLIALVGCVDEEEPAAGVNFDTSSLTIALSRSMQHTTGSLRRATSAPHSLNTLGREPRQQR